MNQNKINSMEAVGELPDMGNLLLREGGFPHLPNPRFVPAPKWNNAGTKPDHPCLCEVMYAPQARTYRFWNGNFWGLGSVNRDQAVTDGNKRDRSHAAMFLPFTWREVQP